MPGAIRPSEALSRNPDFFKKRPSDCNWTLEVKQPDGTVQEFIGVDWVAKSRFGKFENLVVTGPNGEPVYDRPVFSCAPAVATVVWGKCPTTKEVRVAILTQEFQFPIDPKYPGSNQVMRFAQTPLGLRDGQTATAAANREVTEEAGTAVVLRQSRPNYPWATSTPSVITTWAEVVFVEVDIEKLTKVRYTKDEKILAVKFLSIEDLLSAIREGEGQYGVFRDLTTLGLLMMFLAQFPEVWPTKKPPA